LVPPAAHAADGGSSTEADHGEADGFIGGLAFGAER